MVQWRGQARALSFAGDGEPKSQFSAEGLTRDFFRARIAQRLARPVHHEIAIPDNKSRPSKTHIIGRPSPGFLVAATRVKCSLAIRGFPSEPSSNRGASSGV